MPLRCLLYFAEFIKTYMSEKSETLSIYQRRVLKIPSPEFYIVYNGIEELKGQLNNYLKRLSPSKRPSAQKSQIK